MKSNPLFLACMVAFAWGLYPVIARRIPIPSSILTAGISFVATCTVVSYLIYTNRIPLSLVTFKEFGVITIVTMIGCGLLSGIGMITFGKLFSLENGYDVSKYIPIVSSLVPFITVLSSWILFRTPLTFLKLFGALLIGAGIYLTTLEVKSSN